MALFAKPLDKRYAFVYSNAMEKATATYTISILDGAEADIEKIAQTIEPAIIDHNGPWTRMSWYSDITVLRMREEVAYFLGSRKSSLLATTIPETNSVNMVTLYTEVGDFTDFRVILLTRAECA